MSLHINDIRSVCVEYFFDKLIGEFIEKQPFNVVLSHV